MIPEHERFSDVLDQAQAINEQHQESSLAMARAKLLPEQVKNPDGTWPFPDCKDCGDEIPEGRLALGKIRCLSCQDILERRSKGLFSL